MITPQQAKARRDVQTSAKYVQVVKEIDELLCGPPNQRGAEPAWDYEFNPMRDSGQLKHAIIEGYRNAGWLLEIHAEVLRFTESQSQTVPT